MLFTEILDLGARFEKKRLCRNNHEQIHEDVPKDMVFRVSFRRVSKYRYRILVGKIREEVECKIKAQGWLFRGASL